MGSEMQFTPRTTRTTLQHGSGYKQLKDEDLQNSNYADDKLLIKKTQLFRREDVPEEFREPHILGGYRSPGSSPHVCLLSLTQGTNETINVWTHLLSCCFFTWLLTSLGTHMSFATDPYTWPLLPLLCTSCIYPAASAFAHTFNAISLHKRHLCFALDYVGLSLYTFGTNCSVLAYSLPRTWLSSPLVKGVLPFAFLLSVGSSILACHTRLMKRNVKQTLCRLFALSFPTICSTVPLFRRVLWPENWDEAKHYHSLQLIWGAICLSTYALRFPERCLPGRCDVIGHSHQWFHLFSIPANYFQIKAALTDLDNRRDYIGENHYSFPSYIESAGATIVLLVANLIVLTVYYFKFKTVSQDQKKGI